MDFKNYINTLNTEVTYVKGVGEKRKIMLNKLSLYNIWDLVYNFPKDYEDRRLIFKICDIKEGEKCGLKVSAIKLEKDCTEEDLQTK